MQTWRRHWLLIGAVVLLVLIGLISRAAFAAGQSGAMPRVPAATPATAGAGLVFTLERTPARGAIVLLRVANPSRYAWCVNEVSFSPGQFLIKIGSRVIGSRATKVAPLGLPCLTFRPGEAREQKIDLTSAFTPKELRDGVLCYSFAYRHDPANGTSGMFGEIGTVCEGLSGTKYLMPTE